MKPAVNAHMSIRFTPEIKRELEQMAKQDGRSIGNMTRKLIAEAMKARRQSEQQHAE